MSGTLAKVTRRLLRLARYRTHPSIIDSEVADLSAIDPSARVNGSRLYGSVTLGARCILDACRVTANAPVAVGAHSILTGPIRIVADLNPVSIGKYCSIAPDVVLWESAHDARRMSSFFVLSEMFGENFRSDLTSKGGIAIGNDVWIGVRAIVLSGVSVGDGAVIGAGAVVTRDIPPYTIAAGTPAVVVKPRFPAPIAQRLLDLRWWDWPEDRIRRNRRLFEGELTIERLERIE